MKTLYANEIIWKFLQYKKNDFGNSPKNLEMMFNDLLAKVHRVSIVLCFFQNIILKYLIV